MTWFLRPSSAAPTQDARPLDGQVPTWGEQYRRSVVDRWTKRDDWNLSARYVRDLETEMMDALGGYQEIWKLPAEQQREFWNMKTRGAFLARMVGERRADDPDGAFASLPGSEDEFVTAVNDRRKADFDANRAVLARGDSWSAQLLGEMTAAVAEPYSIATMPLGGNVRNFGRFVLTEAALGAATEAPGVIREQRVAKELDFKPSNPIGEIAMGGFAGGAFAGAIGGGVKAVDMLLSRRTAEAAARPEGVRAADWEDELDGREVAMRDGREYTPQPQRGSVPTAAGGGAFSMIRQHEGFREAPYWDVNAWRVGYGSDTITRADGTVVKVTRDMRVSRADAERDLQRRVNTEFMPAAREAVGADLFDGLSGQQQAVLVSLTYNYGTGAWTKGLAGVARAIRGDGDVAGAIRALGAHNDGVNMRRRNQEADAWVAGRGGAPAGRDQFSGFDDAGGSTPALGGFDMPAPRAIQRFEQVTTPAGTAVDVRYRVVDLSELQRATGDLQPRDRSRSASDEQIARIAADLDARRLMPSPEGDRGAPIVGPDMVVESGNGRVAALNRAATEHPDNYAGYVRAIEDAGFAIPEGMRRPVLVAERLTDLDPDARRRFVRENNTSAIARMSATEQAGMDASYLSQHAFDAFRAGRGLGGPENAEFIRRVFAGMPQAERAGLMTDGGMLNMDGLRRLRQALFARAFGAGDLLKLLAEADHPAAAGMLRMLDDLAPDWAAFRAAVDAGYIRPEFDITDALVDAVRMIARARIDGRDGQSVIAAIRDRLAQGDMFAARDADMAEALINAFYRGDRARQPDVSAAILQRYIAEAEQVGRADMADLLGETGSATPLDALRQAIKAQDARDPMPDAFRASDAEPLEGTAEARIDLRGLGDMDTRQGASSPGLTRATDAAVRDLAEAPEIGPFGPVFRDVDGDPEAAIARLMAAETGEVPAAFAHPLFDRPITFVYGRPDQPMPSGKSRSGFGLSHIAQDHGRQVLDDLPDLLRNGTVYRAPDNQPKRYIVDDNNPARVAVVRELWDNDRKNWVVTSFDDDLGDFSDRSQWEAFRVTGLGEERAPSPTGRNQDIPSAADFQPDDIAAAIADARQMLDADPDLSIRMAEGDDAQTHALSDILSDLDQDQSLLQRMNSCALKGTPR